MLDQISGYAAKSPGTGLDQLPGWKRGVLLRVLCRLIEQTKGRDQGQLVRLLRDAGFRDRALADLGQGTGLQRQNACTVLGFFDDVFDRLPVRSLVGPLRRNGRVYIAEVEDRRGRSFRLVLDARNGEILERFARGGPPRPPGGMGRDAAGPDDDGREDPRRFGAPGSASEPG